MNDLRSGKNFFLAVDNFSPLVPVEGSVNICRVGDQAGVLRNFNKIDDRFDFGSHRPRGKVPLLDILFCFFDGNRIQAFLIGFSPIQKHLLNRG